MQWLETLSRVRKAHGILHGSMACDAQVKEADVSLTECGDFCPVGRVWVCSQEAWVYIPPYPVTSCEAAGSLLTHSELYWFSSLKLG